MTPSPPLTPAHHVPTALRELGYAVVDRRGLCELTQIEPRALDALAPSWSELPPDAYLRDGGHYRFRRHACFTVNGGAVISVPHRPHWQPVEYNALHGGMERWFEPISAEIVASPTWRLLLTGLSRGASALNGERTWFVEAHQFRIDTSDGIGRPTPEGAHRDGVDLVAVLLVARHAIKGGETRVFEANGPHGVRFTMNEPWSALLLDDERVIHETTPIQPLVECGHRDTLVLTFRSGGFQGPEP